MFAPVVRVGASAMSVRVITQELKTMRLLLQGNAMIHDARNTFKSSYTETDARAETGYMQGHGHSDWHREHVGYR